MPKRRRSVANAARPHESPIPKAQRDAVKDAAGRVVRPPLVMRDSWADPDDTNYRAKSPRQVEGERRFDSLRTMNARSPNEITGVHLRCAEKYRDLVEATTGARGGADLSGGPRIIVQRR